MYIRAHTGSPGCNINEMTLVRRWKPFVELKLDSRRLDLRTSFHNTEIRTSYKGIYTIMQTLVVKLNSWSTFLFFSPFTCLCFHL